VSDVLVIRALLGGGHDLALAASPPGGTRSCGCVELHGGPGNDKMTSRDGADLYGDDGADFLIGEPNQAFPAPGALRPASSEEMFGGAGDDRLEPGVGPDFLNGGGGIDRMDGGAGDDTLHDGDSASGEIGPDGVIGSTSRSSMEGAAPTG
jgi:Ca2+-binding RTX toxin-like protein